MVVKHEKTIAPERILAVSQRAFERIVTRERRAETWRGGWMRLDQTETLLIDGRGPDRADAAAVVLGIADDDRPTSWVDPSLPLVLFGRRGTILSMSRDPERRFDRVRIVGPGLPEVAIARSGSVADRSSGPRWIDYYSRTRGAMGAEAFERLAELKIAIVGVGRSGTMLAAMLTRAGVSDLSLIDPDRLERHNLGEMPLLSPTVIGRPKVDAVAERLRDQALRPDLAIHVRPESALSLASLYTLKRADVIVTCADGPLARLVASFVAAVYLKPLLDIGTGVLDPQHLGTDRAGRRRRGRPVEPRGGRVMGADVRWVLPGNCLHCFGGIAAMERLAPEAAAGRRDPSSMEEHAWRRERAGSLASLNGLAVSFGMRLLEDFLAARLGGTQWIHLEYDEAGLPSIECRTPPARQVATCPVCRWTGHGDAALAQWRGLLEELSVEQ